MLSRCAVRGAGLSEAAVAETLRESGGCGLPGTQWSCLLQIWSRSVREKGRREGGRKGGRDRGRERRRKRGKEGRGRERKEGRAGKGEKLNTHIVFGERLDGKANLHVNLA